MSGPLLVFGANGQVGQELLALCASRGIDVAGVTRAEADICDASAVSTTITRHKPRLVVNAAAYTAVDRAESEPELAAAVNDRGAGIIAAAASANDAPILHISTDYVFDGSKPDPYVEDDPIAPLGVYGRTKAAGEAAVRAAASKHIILRTAWVYGCHRANFLKTMLRLAGERDHLRVVADQRGCPTATMDIAEAILAVDAKLRSNAAAFGTLHFAGTGATTWHGFAEAIVSAQANVTGKEPPVHGIPTADFPTPAKRPANSELDSSLFAATFGYRAQDWRKRTEEVVASLLQISAAEQRT